MFQETVNIDKRLEQVSLGVKCSSLLHVIKVFTRGKTNCSRQFPWIAIRKIAGLLASIHSSTPSSMQPGNKMQTVLKAFAWKKPTTTNVFKILRS